jgi:hypothetical protein
VHERAAPGVGDREPLGRPPAAAPRLRPCPADLDHALGQQRVQVAPDRGRREADPVAQRRGGDGTVFEHEPGHPSTGVALGHPDRRLLAHVFHNISVP